jgi:hypothetical protein
MRSRTPELSSFLSLATCLLILAVIAAPACRSPEPEPELVVEVFEPQFAPVQEELFGAGFAYTNAIADYDNDGDLDIFVGFNQHPNRLYRNDDGTFTDVAEAAGVADNDVTRAAAWGDYNGDGYLDLFVGFVSREGSWSRLYRNEGGGGSSGEGGDSGGTGSGEDGGTGGAGSGASGGVRFTDVTEATGVGLTGSFRQVSWVDFDNDGDVDLFVGLRDKPNVLFRNDDGRFTDVAEDLGVADPRRTVGAAWFDYDKDGDLDLVVANMDGDANGLFRNDGTGFVDVAVEAGLDDGGRGLGDPAFGTVRPSIGDFNNDGNFDVFTANYGPPGLFMNLGPGSPAQFENVAPATELAIDGRYDTATWGDYDNDGRVDLFVNGTISQGTQYPDYLLHNAGDRFTDVTPPMMNELNADHGAHWADMNGDGALDLALTGGTEEGMHYLLINGLAGEQARRSLQVLVLDSDGHYTRAGAEVRLFDTASGALLGAAIVDTGSGYNSQNAMPVHFGLGALGGPAGSAGQAAQVEGALVDVEITTMTRQGRVRARLAGVEPADYAGRWLVVMVDESGELRQ